MLSPNIDLCGESLSNSGTALLFGWLEMPLKDFQNLYIQSPKLNQLNILREIALNARITQAELADRCSLSVAMINNYMKDLCRQRLLRYHRKSIKNVSYHLTASGAQQLDLLLKERIGEMAQLFANAKAFILDRIKDCHGEAPRRVALFGSGDLAEIVFMAMESSGLNVLCVCDDAPGGRDKRICGRSIEPPLLLCHIAADAVIVTDEPKTRESAEILESLATTGARLIRLDDALPALTPPSAGKSSVLRDHDYRPAESLQYQEA